MKKKMSNRDKTFWAVVIPVVILFFAFNTLPMIKGVIYSFTNYKGYGTYDYVGFRNYADLFTDSRVGKSYLFTFKYALAGTILVNVLSLIMAVGLNSAIRFKSALRGIYFVPNILGGLVIGYIFSFIFTYILPTVGNVFHIGFLQNSILASEKYAWIGVLIVGVWQAVAMNTIIYISGLQTVPDLLNRYPGHLGFMKFRCRFLMENAGENRIEAERFIDKALKKFPEDGYFLKYKADIFWMNGEVQKAAELYLQVKSKTTNGVVWLEMDRFFRGYKAEILKNCEELLAARRKKEALSLMELWNQLIPEDDDIQGAFYLAKVACARTQSEIEQEINEIRRVIEIPMLTPVKEKTNKNKKSEEHQMYKKALTRAWKRLGYSKELAALRTQIICTGEESELEWLAEQVRNRQFRKEEKACVYKLVGDVRMKQGQTREAFANYKKALEYEMSSYVKTELYRIFINDLNDGSRQAKSFAKKADITVVLDNWLDKYGSIEDVKRIVQSVM